MDTTASAAHFAVKLQFERLAQRLEQEARHPSLDRPLADWIVASDRRLPYALLDRSVRELLSCPFRELMSTPGIGLKKASSLIVLLQRALDDSHPTSRLNGEETDGLRNRNAFDPERVSPAIWLQWQSTVRRMRLQRECIGRLVPTLQAVPTVIWDETLERYLDVGLEDLRTMRTHGDKRVRIILEAFHAIHEMFGETQGARLAVSLRLPFVPPIEAWIRQTLHAEEPPAVADIRQHVVFPLLNQIEHDAGEQVQLVLAGRLGVEGAAEDVRDQARERNVTRARIYQLLNVSADVMRVRWPEGQGLLRMLQDSLEQPFGEEESARLVAKLLRILYPTRIRRGEALMRRVAPC